MTHMPLTDLRMSERNQTQNGTYCICNFLYMKSMRSSPILMAGRILIISGERVLTGKEPKAAFHGAGNALCHVLGHKIHQVVPCD